MYRDAGYGENWQPTPNNRARRINPYTQSYTLLGCFFATGVVLIVIVVLSLIPLYISHSSSVDTHAQVPKIYVSGYTLTFRSPWNDFNTNTIVSQASNREALQAALTVMLQNDPILAGSIVDISESSVSSRRRRRQISNLYLLIVDVQVYCGKSCTSLLCLTQFRTNVVHKFSDKNQTPVVRYELINNTNSTSETTSSQAVWLTFHLPNNMTSNASLAIVDLKMISASLANLINIDQTLNKPPDNNLTTSTAIMG